MSPAPYSASQPDHPTRIGSYRILRPIGEGGIGLVFAARREGSGHEVALKVLRVDSGESKLVERFRLEADVLRRLRHPGIAAFYDAGLATVSTRTGSQDVPYIAMEYVEGESLLRHAQSARLDTRQRVELFVRLCDAMQHAHEAGILHRDLKPSNVLVVPDPDDPVGHPKVLDFGVAKALDAHSVADLQTGTGALLGTVPYMSPEQVDGQSRTLDGRSDQYTLGVLLFDLLTGRLPYDVKGRPFLRAAQRIRFEEPDRLGQLDARLAGDLELVMGQVLEKDPAHRYPDVAAFARDLRAYLAGQPVTAHAPGPWRRAKKWLAFHPVAGTTLGVATLASAVMLVLFLQALGARAEAHESELATRENEALTAERTAQLELEKDNVLRLSDLKRLTELEQKAQELWPVHPDRVPALDDWLSEAEGLAGTLDEHQRFLAQLADDSSSLAGSLGPGERAWWLDTLGSLVQDLESFLGDDGTLQGIRRRHATASTLRQRSLVEPVSAWSQARIAIAASDLYGGLELSPQLGLIPLGENPTTGLWEFWHIASGTEPERDPDTGRLWMDEDSAIVLILIPGGVFPMGPGNDPHGTNVEAPTHDVELSPFFIAKYELTQGQWLRCAGSNPAHLQSSTFPSFDLSHPVEKISWQTANTFCQRHGLELPTEAQWEYAARAGTQTPWFTGDLPQDLVFVANVSDQFALDQDGDHSWEHYEPWDDGWWQHAPVGSFEPNAFGLHDTHGNVFEWTRDAFDFLFYGNSPRKDPFNDKNGVEAGDKDYRVIRGGCYLSSALRCRNSARLFYDSQGTSNSSIGVRVGRGVE